MAEKATKTKAEAPAETEEKAKKGRAKQELRPLIKNVPKEAKITRVAAENPKREGSESHARFEKYRKGMTVGEAIAAGVTAGDIRWDYQRNHIDLDEKALERAAAKAEDKAKAAVA